MKNDFDVRHLHVKNFAAAAGRVVGDVPLRTFERLASDAPVTGDDWRVTYSARGELRRAGLPTEQVWLHLAVQTSVAQTCQRCLEPVVVPLAVERSFRFVDNEALAAILDEESEEDVLVLGADFDLLELMEDELLMDLPLVPKHEVCPVTLKTEVVDPDFVEAAQEKRNPFAALEQLKKKSP